MTIFRFFRFAGVSRMLFGGKVLVAEWAGHGSGSLMKLEIRTGFFGVCVVGEGTWSMVGVYEFFWT